MTETDYAAPITQRFPKELFEQMETIAKEIEKPIEVVIERAVEVYLKHEGAEVLEIAEGRQKIANGEYVESDELFRRLKAIDPQ